MTSHHILVIIIPTIIIMIIGIFVRQWSILTLGRYFNTIINVQKDQKVVDYGPYLLVRHPAYTGLLMSMIGMFVALQSLASILAILVLFSLAIGYRIHVEEKLLVSELGDDYIRYMKKTKRLIPFVF